MESAFAFAALTRSISDTSPTRVKIPYARAFHEVISINYIANREKRVYKMKRNCMSCMWGFIFIFVRNYVFLFLIVALLIFL